MTQNRKTSSFAMFCNVLLSLVSCVVVLLRWCVILLYEFPGGNHVDGLPPVAHTGKEGIGPAPQI